MAYLETPDGIPIHHEERGEGETILLVHGWTMNAEYWWQKNVDALAESNHVVTVDLRGHGRSGKPSDGHTMAQYARDVRHVVRSLGLDDLTLVGWSMGAAISMSYVEQFGTERLRSLALVDQSPYFYSEEGWEYPAFGEFGPEGLAGIVDALQTDRSSLVKGELLPAFFVETPAEETIDRMYAETMQTPTAVAVSMLKELCHNDFRDVVPEIDVPTLLVYGAQSAVFPGAGEWMHEQIPDAELLQFEASGHCPFWEEPERFNRELAAFVS